MINIFDFYDKMQRSNILLSFKGEITSELLGSILAIMEDKLETMQEGAKTKRKVYNVLVEALQNLYHHLDGDEEKEQDKNIANSAIFLIAKSEESYSIMTGNYILNEQVDKFKGRLDKINSLSKDELKSYYKDVLNNEGFSQKGGGGLGMIDIARKSGNKLEYSFQEIDSTYSFFSLHIKITNSINLV